MTIWKYFDIINNVTQCGDSRKDKRVMTIMAFNSVVQYYVSSFRGFRHVKSCGIQRVSF